MPSWLRPGLTGLGVLLLAAEARAGAPPKLTLERIHSDPPLAGALPYHLAWHPDGKRLTFLRPAGELADLEAIDVTKGARSVLLTGAKVLLSGEKPHPLSLAHASWLADGKTLLVPAEGDIFTVEAATGRVSALVRTPDEEELAEASPDGRRVAFVRRNDLYVVDLASRRETRLTQGGSDTILNGRLDWVYEEELGGRSGRAFAWSPDSRSIAYLRLDQSRVAAFPIVDFLPIRNEVRWQRYPTPGTPNAVVRLGVVGIDKDGSPGPERLSASSPDDAYLLPQLGWSEDSRSVAFQQLNRPQNELQLRLLPVSSSPRDPLGPARTVLTESSRSWLNTFGPPRFLKDGRRFLCVSERDGFAHVYVCDLTGSCRAVTQGPWMVDAEVSFAGAGASPLFDERTGFLYFSATEKDPRERHLYRVRLDGTGRTRLTREDGTHRVLVSPDGRFYADTWSDLRTPPRIWVSSQDGTRRFPIEDNAAAPVLGYELASTELLELQAKDGATLYASLARPAAFDPHRRYPVVVDVYGGPHVQTVRNAWSETSPFDHLLASHGFLVFRLDNRGSAGRGTAFESAIQRDLGRVELEDQLVGIEYLKSQPFVDPGRLGIVGWSYGGFMTLYAVTNAPDVFQAAVAGAPVVDWRLYDSIYTERYMGTPETNSRGYEASSPLRKAAKLAADLLLVHGTADDNVHLANTVSFVAALVQAGKPYSLRLHPGERHALRSKTDPLARDREILAHLEHALRPGE